MWGNRHAVLSPNVLAYLIVLGFASPDRSGAAQLQQSGHQLNTPLKLSVTPSATRGGVNLFVRLKNRSNRAVTVYGLYPFAVLRVYSLSVDGERIRIPSKSDGLPAISDHHFRTIQPGDAIATVVKWSDYFTVPNSRRVRGCILVYDCSYAAFVGRSFKRPIDSWDGTVQSEMFKIDWAGSTK